MIVKMYKVLILVLLFCLPIIAQSQIGKKFDNGTKKIVVVGYMDKIADDMGVPCGLIASASIFKIKIENSSDLKYHKGEEIYIYILCPQDYGTNYFVNKGEYKFLLSSNMKALKGIVINNRREFINVKVSGWVDSIKLIHR